MTGESQRMPFDVDSAPWQPPTSASSEPPEPKLSEADRIGILEQEVLVLKKKVAQLERRT